MNSAWHSKYLLYNQIYENIGYKYIMYNIYHSSWQLSIIAKKKHLFFLATSREGWSFHPGSPTVGVFVNVNGVAKKLDAGTLKGIAYSPEKSGCWTGNL